MKIRLKELMARKDIKNNELSQLCHLSEQCISNWRNQRNTDTLYKIYLLCKTLNCDIKDLFEE